MATETAEQKGPILSLGAMYALGATFFFSLMQIGVKFLGRLPAHEIVFFRAFFLLLFSVAILRFKKIPLMGVNKPILLLRGLSGAVALYLFFYTIQNVPLATAVTLQYLSPIFTIIIAGFIMKEGATWKQWLALLAALVGIIVIKGFDPRVSMFHAFLGVLSALFSGFAYNFIRKLKDTDHPDVVVMYFPLVTIPCIFPFMLTSWIWPTWQEWLIIVLVGISTQIAQMFMTRSYQLEKAADVVVFKYTGVVYAIFFGLVLFGESVPWSSFIGIAIVIIAVYLGSVGRRQGRNIGPIRES